MPQVDVDEDPTMIDRNPWHEDESTGVRSVPRPSPRSVPRPTPRSSPPPAVAARPSGDVPVRASEPGPSEAMVRWSEPRPSEEVEFLSLPHPLREDLLPAGAKPLGEAQLRVAIVRVVRELGRDYRVRRGRVLRTDAAAIDTAQRHLLGLAAEARAGRVDGRALATEVAKHGALLGEIVARRLGGHWFDLAGDHPGTWKMGVPPRTVFAPIGRVHRFLVQQNREQDLVSLFLDLDAASRGAAVQSASRPGAP